MEVTISYKGSVIASLDETDDVTLDTAGTYCEDDILIEYTRPEPILQSKSVSVSESPQTIQANSGYDGLSEVLVGAISPSYVGSGVTRKAAQTYTPTTSDQTIAASQYLTGTQTIKGDANLVPANIAEGIEMFGVTGTYTKPSESDPVRFYDYDGTLLYSYSVADFANLTAMPANPSHPGLIAEGWNWTLADAKTYVSTYGQHVIGQNYITDDGKTRIYIRLCKGRTSPVFSLSVNGSVSVNWGDNSSDETITGSSNSTVINTTHNYPDEDGDYMIAITPISGKFFLYGAATYSKILWKNSAIAQENRPYNAAIRRVEIGSNCYFGDYSFTYCYNLETITIPIDGNGVGSSSVLNDCYALRCLILPSIQTRLSATCARCYSLRTVSLPKSVSIIGASFFNSCHSLRNFALPPDLESLDQNFFNNVYGLPSIKIPSSVTSLGKSLFQNCPELRDITIPASVTTLGDNLFTGCSALVSATFLGNITNITEYMFSGCYSLRDFTIPSTVTAIAAYAFYNCYSLASITIPENVTTIGANAFNNCYGLSEIHFESSTPPTVANSNAWTNLPTDCKIYVPFVASDRYATATNYPDPNVYEYVFVGNGGDLPDPEDPFGDLDL